MNAQSPPYANASKARVLAALAFEPPDIVPIFDEYWEEFRAEWRSLKGFSASGGDPNAPSSAPNDWDIVEYYGVDVRIAIPDETLWPSRARALEPSGDFTREIDGWGRVIRKRPGSYFLVEESPGMEADDHDVDALEFEPADADCRYESFEKVVAVERLRRCVFTKVGGPFIRTCFLRGMEQWLLDLALHPDFARDLVERMTDHHIAIGLESLRRANLWDTGVLINDDMCSHRGPMFSPQMFERIFLPDYARMIGAFKDAGARFVILHCDGDLRPLLPMLVDAGIDAINPVQYNAGMKIGELQRLYGRRLAYVGGMDNAQILPYGSDAEARRHFDELVEWARFGGVVLGGHSIGLDVSVQRYEFYHRTIRPGWEPPAWADGR